MSPKSEFYRRQFNAYWAQAEGCTPEIAALWLELANSDRFLAEREERIEAENDSAPAGPDEPARRHGGR